MNGTARKIVAFYNDGGGVVRRDGTLIELNDFLTMETTGGHRILIPRERIIRIEEVQ